MQDNGSRYEHETGALREDVSTKGMRPELIPPEALMRVATWYGDGAKKYGDRNWEKGLPFTNCLGSMFRHLIKYMNGQEDEDHLAAIVWNANALMHYEKHKPDMDDRPAWTNGMRKTQARPICANANDAPVLNTSNCKKVSDIYYDEYIKKQCQVPKIEGVKEKAEIEKLQKVAAIFAAIEEML